MAYIYSITNNINQKKYIGKTTKNNPYDRWKEHIRNAKALDNTVAYSSLHTMPIIRALKKYGSDNFKFRVLEECIDDNVDIREKHYITEYNTCDGKMVLNNRLVINIEIDWIRKNFVILVSDKKFSYLG